MNPAVPPNRPLTRSYAVADISVQPTIVPGPLPAIIHPQQIVTAKRKPGRPRKVQPSSHTPEDNAGITTEAIVTQEKTLRLSPGPSNHRQAAQAVGLRSPLPHRKKRVVNPGAPDKKRGRRTTAEVEAAEARRRDLHRKMVELERQKVLMMAELELDQELANKQEEAIAVRHITDIVDMDVHIGAISEDSESVEPNDSMIEMDSADPSDSDLDQAVAVGMDLTRYQGKPTTKIAGRRKKPAKGEIRAAVAAAKIALRKGKARDNNRSSTGNGKRMKPLFPSGLVSGWESKASRSSGSHNALSTLAIAVAGPEIGGLNDEDAEACQPDATTLSQFGLRVVVAISDQSESDSLSGSDAAALNTPLITSKRSHTLKHGKVSSKLRSTKKAVKAEATALELQKPNTMSMSMSSSISPNNRNSADLAMLPSFARAGWTTRFLPTLYHLLGSAPKPWDLGDNGSNMVITIQKVIDIVYPYSGHTLKLGDKILTMSKDRLNDKRTLVGRQAIKKVTEFFKGAEFTNNPAAIAAYVRWAISEDGPAIWGEPTPKECVVLKTSDDYIKPDGIFESDFVIDIFAGFAKSCKGSCHDYGYLQGALALVAAAIERAFMMFETGNRIDKGQFSRERIGPLVDDYVISTSQLSSRRWERIIKKCGSHAMQEKAPFNPATIQEVRRNLYTPSSPIAPAKSGADCD